MITVTNIYGKHNLGDNAIRNSGFSVLSELKNVKELKLLCETKNDFPIQSKIIPSYEIEYAPYGFGIRSTTKAKSILVKLLRLLKISTGSLYYSGICLINDNFISEQSFFRYIKWIKKSDLVIGMGGGYFVSRNAFRDSYGIVLNALPLYIAKLFRKRIVMLPISFGPFNNKVHEFIIGNAVKNTITLCRDKISLSLVQKYNPHASFIPDLALYDWDERINKDRESFYLLSFRDYLPKVKQQKIEAEIIKVIDYLWENEKRQCVFIPTGANPIEENDIIVGERLQKKVKDKKSFKIVVPKSPDEIKQLMRKSNFAFCHRMHAGILSATTFTPFIAFAYEHKFTGLMQVLSLSKWELDFSSLTAEAIINIYKKLMIKKNYEDFLITLEKKKQYFMNYRKDLVNLLERLTE